MWSVWERVFKRTPPIGFATRQPHCGCFALKSPPTRILEPNEERNVEKCCYVICLFGGQYTADTENSKTWTGYFNGSGLHEICGMTGN
jgi:hypothetical protein